MRTTIQHVTALYSVKQDNGTFQQLDTAIVAVGRNPHLPTFHAGDVHKALTDYLRETDAPAGIYGFEFNGEFRNDRWDGTDFIGCTCDGAKGDLACDMYACWGRADRQAASAVRASKAAA